MWWISIGCNVSHPSFLPLSHGAIILVLEDNEAYSKFPVSIANRIGSAITHGGCNDCALLGVLRDRRYYGYA